VHLITCSVQGFKGEAAAPPVAPEAGAASDVRGVSDVEGTTPGASAVAAKACDDVEGGGGGALNPKR